MIVLNIYGIPGSQKSKFLSNAFAKLSYKGEECAIIGDFNIDLSKNSFHILGNILDKLDTAKHKDIVINSTPLLLQPVYYRQTELPDPDMFEILTYQMYLKYTNVNIVVDDPSNTYIYRDLIDMFSKYEIPYDVVKSIDDYTYSAILQKILARLQGDW